jgi:hypothetical protein
MASAQFKDADRRIVFFRQIKLDPLFSKRVIQTKSTAPTNATTIEPIMPLPGQIPKVPKTQTAQDATENTQNDVNDYAVATTLHNLASEPSCYQANHNPRQDSR